MSEPSQPKNNNNKGEGSSTKKKTYRRPKKKTQEPANGEQKTNSSQPKFNKNRAQSKLTIDDGSAASSSVTTPPPEKKKRNPRNNRNHKKIKLPEGEHDLSTVLTHDLRNSSYECMICMDVIRPAHQVWTCDCCWAVFHLNCIHQWANKSLKDTSSNKMITQWRCPGCQHTRTVVPKDYFCFCGKQRNPENVKYSTPHSCDQLCKRHKSCPHECVLPCHPGPCPPCSLMGPVITCYCGQNARQGRCVDTDYSTKGYSCEEVCGELLGCGKHRCKENCHSGLCTPCEVEEIQSCYCGRHERTARCGNGKQIQLRGHIGYYSCGEKCDIVFACGQHHCQKSCHPCTANSQTCPFDPTVIKTCPCGSQKTTHLLSGQERASCSDPIPTCDSVCNKTLLCGHQCQEKCHLGDCSPCEVVLKVPCRCRSTMFEESCANVCEETGGEPPLCDRICKSVRNCGRHTCGNRCCVAVKINGKKKAGMDFVHDCPEICNKLLSCGLHDCKAKCHKGKCQPCLEATFDEITCHCGRTRLEPPIRCGTKFPPCPHPCIRPNPCGHIRFLQHNCHPDEEQCPPCPALVSRHCLCGKSELKNVPCYRESPRCGRICEKLLPCGKHFCTKSCHAAPCVDENEQCTQLCGNSKSCGHPCQAKCHGDAPCPEESPCTARIRATCKCGQNSMEIPCNATAQTSGSNQVLECNDFCAKVLRNRRLAEALDIKREESPDKSLSFDELGYYDDTLCEFYLENPAWCKRMEVTLSEFVQDDSKKTLHFKPMRSQYRRFIHRYAVHFNVSTEAIDPEPQRSIVVRKNIGAYRVPSILLSRAARNPSLNRPPTQLQEGVPKPASKQPVNSLYLSDMAFGLTKLELDAALVPVLKLGEDTINFTSRWVNENDAIVTPLIDDSVSVDEREIIIWQLKKLVKAAFVQNSEDDKASRVDCCWVNQKGEVTWNEKDFSTAINKGDINPTQVDMDKRSANSFATLNTVDDDGWMRVGKINPYKPTVDAWQEMPKNVNSSLVRQAKEEEAKDEEAKDEETKDEEKKVVDDNIEQPVTVETAKPLENNVADKEGEVEESEDWEVDEP